MERVAIVRALRTPIGKFLGGLSTLSAPELGIAVVPALLDGLDLQIDELIFGCGRQAGSGPNIARQVAVKSGLGEDCVALTVNMACGSGLKSIALGVEAIELGGARAVGAGGT